MIGTRLNWDWSLDKKLYSKWSEIVDLMAG